MALPHLRLPTVQVAGLVHFPRMIDKIRLSQAGKLPEDYVLGNGDGTCLDGRICRFFKVEFEALRTFVETGASDDAILAWFEAAATDFTPERILIISQFISKRGFRDESSASLVARKKEAGFGDRPDILTWMDLIAAEES